MNGPRPYVIACVVVVAIVSFILMLNAITVGPAKAPEWQPIFIITIMALFVSFIAGYFFGSRRK